jgi:hypothetical protein
MAAILPGISSGQDKVYQVDGLFLIPLFEMQEKLSMKPPVDHPSLFSDQNWLICLHLIQSLIREYDHCNGPRPTAIHP